MRSYLSLILAPLTFLVAASTRVNAHPHNPSLFSLALSGDICAPYKDMGYCFEAYETSLFSAALSNGPSVIVIQPIGGKFVQAFGRCSNCSGEWYTKGSAYVYRDFMGQVAELWRCKGRFELGIVNGNGHCHRIQ